MHRDDAGPDPAPGPAQPCRVDRSRWLTVLAQLSKEAPARQQGYYARLRRLRVVMADDGWLSRPAARLRTAMGAASQRTTEDTLTFAVAHDLLVREVVGRKRQQAVYRATLPADLAVPHTESVMRLSNRTGERFPDGRRARRQPAPKSANTQVGGLPGDALARTELPSVAGRSTGRLARTETPCQPAPGCGPRTSRDQGNPPPSAAVHHPPHRRPAAQ